MKFVYYFCVMILPVCLLAQDKSRYDVKNDKFEKTYTASNLKAPEFLVANSDYLAITMSKEGFFTIGTNEGISESPLDDRCQITYGHPYAMTSYPVFAVDDEWYTMKDYFTNSDSLNIQHEAGSLMLTGIKENGLKITFALIARTETATIDFLFQIENTDAISHQIIPGIILDPALGKWGDGVLYSGSTFCLRDTIISDGQIENNIELWEKNTGALGIGSEINFLTAKPQTLILANWNDEYNNITPDFNYSTLRDLYDLLIKMYWSPIELSANEQFELRLEINLVNPDFTSKVFARCDIPRFLSMHNNLMFPVDMKTCFEIYNTTNNNLEGLSLELNASGSINPATKTIEFSIDAAGKHYQNASVNASLVYEDKIIRLNSSIYENDVLIESLNHNIFFPATPVSDTGLIIVDDSLSVEDYPEIDLIFSAEIEESGQRILDLGEENIFLYENDQRITDFEISKYEGGGVNQADIIFVLDVTGSMSNEISAVKNNLVEFTDSLSHKGIDFRLGMVTFLDDIENIYNFTNDVQQFQSYIDVQYAHGGGDGPENSLDALMAALQFNFRSSANKVFIWITDNTYHEEDNVSSLSAENVVDDLLLNGVAVHCIGNEAYQTSYNRIIIPTNGSFYNIYGNFRDILLNITRFEVQDRYQLSYQSKLDIETDKLIYLTIHYAGLGVIKSYNIQGHEAIAEQYQLEAFPNPFNPKITVQVNKPINYTGNISIYNIRGQLINKFKLPYKQSYSIIWNGQNQQGNKVGTGVYFIQLILEDIQGNVYKKSKRILYVK